MLDAWQRTRTSRSRSWTAPPAVTPSELAELIAAGQIAVATTRDGRIVGSVQVRQVAHDVGERHSREHGLRAIQLELLVPREWRHPSKVFLESWYGRLGYRLVHTRRVEETHPHLAPLLATRCDLQVHEKPLTPTTSSEAFSGDDVAA